MEYASMGSEGHSRQMRSLALSRMLAVIGATFVCLLLAAWITSRFFAPITFR